MVFGYQVGVWGDLGIPAMRRIGLGGCWVFLGFPSERFLGCWGSLGHFWESVQWDRFGLSGCGDFWGFPLKSGSSKFGGA